MKKIACLSALACVLAVSAGSAMAQSTVSVGYAQSDFQGVANKANGVNLKYRWEDGTDPLGWIGSFTYTTKNNTIDGYYNKANFYSLSGGPALRLNDWASIYGVVGVGYGTRKFNSNVPRNDNQNDRWGFVYGAGLQFNPIQDIAIDAGYEQSRLKNTDIGTWIVGVGYSF
ncbi:outer membrane protein OmpX [Candidatus Pantoea multigeneris]|uniref:Outer membrane protein X n=1 Tax=Candidatus Pantoea multigeneris TaxID=2608357 RepID=A0ABX0R8C8_9GAMM|nr:outer membrane protein OmpX [Pantoea multigeneris]NIF20713.1 outer membrane protein OmpX [Pantoea multigeneris]